MAGSSNLNRLEDLLSSGCRGAEPEVGRALAAVEAELKSTSAPRAHSEYSRAYFLRMHSLLKRIRGTNFADSRVSILLQCFKFFQLIGTENRKALEIAETLVEVADLSNNKLHQSKAYSGLAVVLADEHRIADAVMLYSTAIRLAREVNDPFSLFAACINLGCALMYGSLYRDAIPCFRSAWKTAEEHSDPRFTVSRPAALCNLAQTHSYLDEWQEAYEVIKWAIRISVADPSPQGLYGRTVREYTFVRIAVQLAKRAEAQEHLSQCIHFARQSGMPRAAAVSRLAEGLYTVKYDNVDRGLALLESVRQESTLAGSAGVMHDTALFALVKAYDEAGRPEMSLRCLHELSQQVRASRVEGLMALRSVRHKEGDRHRDADLKAISILELRLRAEVAERETEAVRVEMLERLAVTADLKEDLSGEHGFRVGALSAAIVKELGWTPESTRELDLAARLHDIGKTAVPDRILLSVNTLAEAERQFISAHTSVGAELLANGIASHLKIAAQVARHHHEWWNGEGYPSKLSGNRIPIHARIVALADVFDALTHGRPYAPAWPVERALAEIRSRRGTQFDPELTDVFLNLMERLISEHEDLDTYLGQASRHSPFLQARNKIRQMLEAERENEKRATVDGNQTRH